MKKVIIVGAGISGLTLAYFLEKKYGKEIEITLIEKEKRVGGWLRTYITDEVLFEQGPRGFRTKGKGAITKQLADELALTIIDAAPTAKKRYIALEGKLEEVNPTYLLKRGGISLLFELFRKKSEGRDVSVASFFRRRLSNSYVQNLIYPLCQGIYAQDPEELSIQACFSGLWKAEQEHGSLIKALLKQRPSKIAPLSSFVGGMEALPKALVKRLSSTLLLGEAVEEILPQSTGVRVQLKERVVEADHLFLATPHLFNLAPSFPQRRISLTAVNYAFSKEVLKKEGFGLLNARTEPFLGITFDSKIFAEHNQPGQTRLCVMLKGEYSQERARELADKGLQTYLRIEEKPDHLVISVAKDAIAQYPVGHLERVKEIEAKLPPSITLTGSRFYGVAVNECIHRSYELAQNYKF